MRLCVLLLFMAFSWGIAAPVSHPLTLSSLLRKPKLILVVVIDQFRSDYLLRFHGKFLPPKTKDGVGGFRYLMEEGAYFPGAQYEMLQNMTGPGHATVLTGAYPYQAGIPLNAWFDVEKEKPVYCSEGGSPQFLNASTLGDELKNTGASSKVIAVSLKDRAAIFLAGHRGDGAFWIDRESLQWVSSPYYLKGKPSPAFVATENQTLRGKTEKSLTGPLGVEINLHFALNALKTFSLGRGSGPDVFAVSFSTHDYVGHTFGPLSPEIEAVTATEYKALSSLLNAVAGQVPGGLSSVLIVLTADHGIPPIPETLAKAGFPAGRVGKDLLSRINTHMESVYGKAKAGQWVLFLREMNYFLNPRAIAEKKLSHQEVEDAVRAFVDKNEPGILRTVTKTDYLTHRLPPELWGRQLARSYYPGRSGDLISILKPYYIMSDDPTDHMTGYTYDRSVPLILAGASFQKGVYTGGNIVDIAPTLAFLLGIPAPSMSEGRVLSEILR